jgi:hypothetical protein
MATVFVSYRGPDLASAERLANDIVAAGHDVWLAEWQLEVGDSIVAGISKGLAKAEYLVLCCSAAGDSAWTSREWMSGLARQLEGQGIKLLPVLLPGAKLPPLLADLQFADLARDWAGGTARLLRAIR